MFPSEYPQEHTACTDLLCRSAADEGTFNKSAGGGGAPQASSCMSEVKRETGEVVVGADNHERRARKRTGWKAHIESKTLGADLPSSWRSTSTKTHSLPSQLGSRSLTLGPPVDTALWRAMATSELPRQGANLSANRVDFSSSATPASPPVPILRLQTSERGESVKETTWTNQHTSLGCEGKKGEGKEKKRAEELKSTRLALKLETLLAIFDILFCSRVIHRFVPKNGSKLTCGRVIQHNFISKANLKNPEQGFLVHRFYLPRKQKERLWQSRFST